MLDSFCFCLKKSATVLQLRFLIFMQWLMIPVIFFCFLKTKNATLSYMKETKNKKP